MRARRIERPALNRGTAVHVGGSRVRFVWACGCTKVEDMKDVAGKHATHYGVAAMVRHWRANGVSLLQCRKHPHFHDPKSQLEKLNLAHPQGVVTGRDRA